MRRNTLVDIKRMGWPLLQLADSSGRAYTRIVWLIAACGASVAMFFA
jgi:hypothetical protein